MRGSFGGRIGGRKRSPAYRQPGSSPMEANGQRLGSGNSGRWFLLATTFAATTIITSGRATRPGRPNKTNQCGISAYLPSIIRMSTKSTPSFGVAGRQRLHLHKRPTLDLRHPIPPGSAVGMGRCSSDRTAIADWLAILAVRQLQACAGKAAPPGLPAPDRGPHSGRRRLRRCEANMNDMFRCLRKRARQRTGTGQFRNQDPHSGHYRKLSS